MPLTAYPFPPPLTSLLPDVRQCLIYDAPTPSSRLIGIEYMISPRLYETLPAEERKLWHSHIYEVKSGMVFMPRPSLVPTSLWEVAEKNEMEQLIGLYGKTYHLWQVDRGDTVPMGEAQLMTSFTEEEQIERFRDVIKDRDERFGITMTAKAEGRKHIYEPHVHEGKCEGQASGGIWQH